MSHYLNTIRFPLITGTIWIGELQCIVRASRKGLAVFLNWYVDNDTTCAHIKHKLVVYS